MEYIVLKSNIQQDEYTNFVCENYDIQNREEVVTTIPMLDTSELSTFTWNVGVILGNSGSGKSTILKRLGEVYSPSYSDKCVISQFSNMSPEEVTELLQGVGLSSVPTWLRKPNELSNGERARLDLAMALANATADKPILIDEFTSVVNRHAASSMSFSLQRYVRKHNLQVILSSCHFDIIEFLTPDWVFNLNKTDSSSEIEHFIYGDEKQYTAYPKVDPNLILSDKQNLP